jgi:mono/diheme cytochrome c family protein
LILAAVLTALFPVVVRAQTSGTPDPAVAGAPTGGGPEPGSVDLFVRKCVSCHTVGKGDRVGPDLKGAIERRGRPWVERFVAAPSAMLDTDPQARELLTRFKGVRMPDLGLTASQAESLAALVALCSTAECDLQGKFTPVTQTTAEHVARGRDLFAGRVALQNGGASCLSCHTARGAGAGIAGGIFARDLTNAFARLGDQGLDAALKAPAFRVMGRAFGARPLTDDEAMALRAFLYDANRAQPAPEEALSLPLVAALGTLAVLGILNAIWARRLRGVRSALSARPRQEKTS